MKIPSEVKVGPYIYKVSIVDIVDKNNPEYIGTAQHDYDKEIRLCSDLDRDKMESVFLHELIHCVDAIFRIGLTEEQVHQLEAGLYMVLKQNNFLRED